MKKAARIIGFCLLVFYLLPGTVKAQNNDSLIGLLKTAKVDTTRISLCFNIAKTYYYTDPVKGEPYLLQALSLSKKINDPRAIAKSYAFLGINYSLTGNDKKSEIYLKKALSAFEKQHHNQGTISMLAEISRLHLRKEQFSEALKYRLKSMAISEEIRDTLNMAINLSGVAHIYSKTGQYAEAEKWFLRALDIKRKMGDLRGESIVYSSLGAMFYDAEKDNIALIYLKKALAIQEKQGDTRIILSCNENMAGIFARQNKLLEALATYKKCHTMYTALRDTAGMSRSMMGLANVQMGSNNFREAEQSLLTAIALQKNTEDLEWTRSAYYSLCLVYIYLGEPDEAHKYMDKLFDLNQKTFNSELSANMAEFKVKYEAEKKEKDNLLLREQNKASNAVSEKRRLWIIAISAFTLLLLVVLLLLVTLNRNRKKQKQIEFIKVKAELEQTALRAQMNPHFIFNALNSIQHYVLNGDTEYAYDYLAKFSRLIRQILVNSEHSTISLSKEIDMLKLYIELEQRRFKNRFDFEIIYANDFPADDVRIPTMLIQPFVENAIWHGIMNLDKNIKGELQLEFDLREKDLHIAVRDNGVGRKEAAQRRINNEYQSVGMAFTKKRLDLIGAVSKQKAQINIVDSVDPEGKAAGTMVEIVIALEVEA